MAEKTLQTRIALKIDTYENWSKSSLVLKKGEVGFIIVNEKRDGEVNYVPSVTSFVGDGEHTFAELGFNYYSKSSDVYNWAKAAVKPSYSADEISGIDARIADYVSNEMGIEVDTDTQYNIVKVNDYQYKLMSKSKGDETFATEVATIDIPQYDDTTVKADIATNASAINALEALVGETAVATQITNAIAALKLAETYAAKVHTHTKADITDFAHTHEMSEVNGLVDSLAGKETAGEAAKVQDNLDAYIESNDAALALKADKTEVEALASKVGTVADDTTVVDMVEAVDVKVVKNTGDIITINETIKNIQENAYDDTELRGLVQDNADAISALEQAHADDKAALEVSIKSNADAITLLTNGVDSETIDGVNDLIAYVNEHGAEVTQIKADIKTNADDIDALEGRMDSAEEALGTVDSRIEAAITGANLDQYALDTDLAAAVERIGALEDADEAQDELLAGLRTDVDLKATKEEHDALVAVVNTKADQTSLDSVDERVETLETEIVKKANDADLAAIAKTGSTDDLVQGEMVLVFDCGGAE